MVGDSSVADDRNGWGVSFSFAAVNMKRLRRMGGEPVGFTLVELLVVMSIFTALGLLALMVVPGARNSEFTIQGAYTLQSSYQTAQGHAAGARLPRGIRIVAPADGSLYATELQLLEMPPVLVPNPRPRSGRQPGPGSGAWPCPPVPIRARVSRVSRVSNFSRPTP